MKWTIEDLEKQAEARGLKKTQPSDESVVRFVFGCWCVLTVLAVGLILFGGG